MQQARQVCMEHIDGNINARRRRLHQCKMGATVYIDMVEGHIGISVPISCDDISPGSIFLGDADTDNIIIQGELSSSIIPDADKLVLDIDFLSIKRKLEAQTKLTGYISDIFMSRRVIIGTLQRDLNKINDILNRLNEEVEN